MKSITSVISAVLGLLAFALFLSISVSLPLWGKVVYAILCIGNLVNCYIAAKRFEEGKLAFNPILSWLIQMVISFGVLAIL